MKITNVSGSDMDRVERLMRRAAALQSLDELLAWGREEPFQFTSPATITDVVVQDEYTHDVIVSLRHGVVLVYDST